MLHYYCKLCELLVSWSNYVKHFIYIRSIWSHINTSVRSAASVSMVTLHNRRYSRLITSLPQIWVAWTGELKQSAQLSPNTEQLFARWRNISPKTFHCSCSVYYLAGCWQVVGLPAWSNRQKIVVIPLSAVSPVIKLVFDSGPDLAFHWEAADPGSVALSYLYGNFALRTISNSTSQNVR